MERDSGIKPILPQYSVVDRVQEVNRQRPELYKGKSEGGSEKKKKRRTRSRPAGHETDAQEARPAGKKDASDTEEDDAPDNAPHEPGKIIDLVI